MASKAIKFLEAHESESPSRFVEEAAWRKENASWLRWSRQLAVTLIGYMQDNGMKRKESNVCRSSLLMRWRSMLSATLFSVFNIVLSKYIEVNILLLLDIAAWTLSNNFLTKMRLKHEAKVKEAEENHTKNSNP